MPTLSSDAEGPNGASATFYEGVKKRSPVVSVSLSEQRLLEDALEDLQDNLGVRFVDFGFTELARLACAHGAGTVEVTLATHTANVSMTIFVTDEDSGRGPEIYSIRTTR